MNINNYHFLPLSSDFKIVYTQNIPIYGLKNLLSLKMPLNRIIHEMKIHLMKCSTQDNISTQSNLYISSNGVCYFLIDHLKDGFHLKSIIPLYDENI